MYLLLNEIPGQVVRKLVNTNPGLKVNQSCHNFSNFFAKLSKTFLDGSFQVEIFKFYTLANISLQIQLHKCTGVSRLTSNTIVLCFFFL